MDSGSATNNSTPAKKSVSSFFSKGATAKRPTANGANSGSGSQGRGSMRGDVGYTGIRANYNGSRKRNRLDEFEDADEQALLQEERKYKEVTGSYGDPSSQFVPLCFGKGRVAGYEDLGGRPGARRNDDIDFGLHKRKRSNPSTVSTSSKYGSSMMDDGRHWSQKRLDEMTMRDWRIFKEDFNISTRGGNIPNPLRSWYEDSAIPDKLLQTIKESGYRDPTPIQRQSIPLCLQNRDVVGIAQTGSGKTASFVVPMLCFIDKLPRFTEATMGLGPYALILAPTRELALQIKEEAVKLSRRSDMNISAIVGGHSMEDQAFSMRNGAHVIVATPGRLRDCLENRIVVLSQCIYIVLDEADKMLDSGFEEDLNFILDSLPATNAKTISSNANVNPEDEDDDDIWNNAPKKRSNGSNKKVPKVNNKSSNGMKIEVPVRKEEKEEGEAEDEEGEIVETSDREPQKKSSTILPKHIYRQMLMFSATMQPSVERLAKKYLCRPAMVTIGSTGQVVDTIEQQVELIPDNEQRRKTRLITILKGAIAKKDGGPIIVFVNQKKTCDLVAKGLERDGRISCVTLHGGKGQDQREAALDQLKRGIKRVLVATNVAGRGIDIKDVSLVVNYDMPNSIEDYTHRIGRTGRAGKKGLAISFIDEKKDSDILYPLKKLLTKSSISTVPNWLRRYDLAQTKLFK